MKINYKSEVTGARTSARVDENLWEIFRKVAKLTGAQLNDPRYQVEHWLTQFDREYRKFAADEAATFSAYISKRLKEEIMLDLSVLEDNQERLQFA